MLEPAGVLDPTPQEVRTPIAHKLIASATRPPRDLANDELTADLE